MSRACLLDRYARISGRIGSVPVGDNPNRVDGWRGRANVQLYGTGMRGHCEMNSTFVVDLLGVSDKRAGDAVVIGDGSSVRMPGILRSVEMSTRSVSIAPGRLGSTVMCARAFSKRACCVRSEPPVISALPFEGSESG